MEKSNNGTGNGLIEESCSKRSNAWFNVTSNISRVFNNLFGVAEHTEVKSQQTPEVSTPVNNRIQSDSSIQELVERRTKTLEKLREKTGESERIFTRTPEFERRMQVVDQLYYSRSSTPQRQVDSKKRKNSEESNIASARKIPKIHGKEEMKEQERGQDTDEEPSLVPDNCPNQILLALQRKRDYMNDLDQEKKTSTTTTTNNKLTTNNKPDKLLQQLLNSRQVVEQSKARKSRVPNTLNQPKISDSVQSAISYRMNIANLLNRTDPSISSDSEDSELDEIDSEEEEINEIKENKLQIPDTSISSQKSERSIHQDKSSQDQITLISSSPKAGSTPIDQYRTKNNVHKNNNTTTGGTKKVLLADIIRSRYAEAALSEDIPKEHQGKDSVDNSIIGGKTYSDLTISAFKNQDEISQWRKNRSTV
ncbi:hypothetical protein CAAN1_02S08196 [[Candida] anglica]|uniref:Uncharacterized protein n=1 Tax=[Candida] anglica TaxID=148631 RepID=A0ABP0EEN4_9ASCO